MDKDSFTAKVFRKTTYTGLILNFTAMCPKKWKVGLIHCLLHRAYTISSDWNLFSQEIDFLKDIFTKNGYPVDLFFSCLKKFLNVKCGDIKMDKISDDKVETIFSIPYIGLPSVIFEKSRLYLRISTILVLE